jgi:hypothetical protein
MAIVTAEVQIRGLRPLLLHVFGPDSLPLERQEKVGVAGHDPSEWRKTFTATPQGQLFMRSDYAFSCLVNAAKYTREKRTSLMGKMAATLQIMDDLLLNRWMPEEDPPMNDYAAPVYLDVRGAVNPSTRGRCVRYRVACSPGWETTFRAIFESTLINPQQFELILLDAGMLVGLADGRSIGMGRFETVNLAFSGNGK